VIGAGLGGLAAGLRLAAAGVRTLVVEHRDRIGGRCQTIRSRHGLLPTGTVVVPCNDFLEEMYASYAVAFDVTRLPTRGVYEVGGRFVPVPDRGALRVLADTAGEPDSPVLVAVRAAVRTGDAPADVSMRDWLSRYTSNPALLGAFQALAGAYLATNAYEVSARAFVRYLIGTAGGGQVGIPDRGWGALVEPLGGRLRALGGELWTRVSARRLLVREGRVVGAVVRTRSGDVSVAADVVVSDTGPAATVRLAEPGVWGTGYLAEVAAVRSSPGVALFLRHPEPLYDGAGPVLPSSARRACFVITPPAVAPALADDGALWTEVLVTFDDSTVQTAAAGRAAVDEAMRDLAALFPALRPQWLVKAIVYRGDWPIYRAWPDLDLPQRTPIHHLLLAGDACKPSGLNGTSSAARSGHDAAGLALDLLGAA
jgi:phytoene dehydrogenase-like protein